MAAETGTQAIDRAAELLVSVVESPRPLAIGELSERTGLPKSTTSRLVGALERRGLVQRAGDRRVVPGPVLLRFAHRDTGAGLVELAAPIFGPDGNAVAALSISAPTIRLSRDRIGELAPALMEQARLVSARLGHEKRGVA